MPSSLASALFLFAFLLAVIGAPLAAVGFGVAALCFELVVFVAGGRVTDLSE